MFVKLTAGSGRLCLPERLCIWFFVSNDQWRICFVWTDVGPEGEQIVDYH